MTVGGFLGRWRSKVAESELGCSWETVSDSAVAKASIRMRLVGALFVNEGARVDSMEVELVLALWILCLCPVKGIVLLICYYADKSFKDLRCKVIYLGAIDFNILLTDRLFIQLGRRSKLQSEQW
jgi:hypothetical protein